MKTRKIELGLGFEYELERIDYFMIADKLRRLASKTNTNKTIIEFDDSDVDKNLKKQFVKVGDTVTEMLDLEIV
jgi:hypothetical protein